MYIRSMRIREGMKNCFPINDFFLYGRFSFLLMVAFCIDFVPIDDFPV
jgi:hypothetical protein